MDLLDMFGPSDMTDHLIPFVNYLYPNFGLAIDSDIPPAQDTLETQRAVHWPKYSLQDKVMLAYLDGSAPVRLVQDVEREEQVRYMVEFLKKSWLR